MKKYDALQTIKKRDTKKEVLLKIGGKISSKLKWIIKSSQAIMKMSVSGIKIGEALKDIEIKPDKTFQKIYTAYLLGVIDYFAQVKKVRENEIIYAMSLYLDNYAFQDKKRCKDLFNWIMKNYLQEDVLAVKQIGGSFALQAAKIKIEKPIAFFGAIYKNRKKSVFN